METSNKRKLLIWSIIILVIINVTALATIAWFRFFRPVIPPADVAVIQQDNPHPRQLYRFLREELGLTASQLEDLKRGDEENFIQTRLILDALQEKRMAIVEELTAEKPDTAGLNRFAAEIGSLHRSLKITTNNHFLNIKRMCNAQQQEKLNRFIRDMAPCPGGGQHRHRHGQKERQH
ncbi:MAG: periplasmic heavy metal sensor [Bacteroidetes bacterium]|nr:periplasmic heavy metal sensor [Bacteroidota bacterium]